MAMASTIVRTTSEAPRSPSGGPHDAGGSGSSGAAEPLSNQPTNSLLHARLGQFTPVSRQTHGHTPTDARRPVFLACQWGGYTNQRWDISENSAYTRTDEHTYTKQTDTKQAYNEHILTRELQPPSRWQRNDAAVDR